MLARDAFTAFKAKPEEKLPSPLPPIVKQRHATTVLSIQHTVAWVGLSTYFCRDRTSYDLFVHHFQQIIVLAEAVVWNGDSDLNMSASSIPTNPLPPSTVDMGIIQSLFFIACRRPTTSCHTSTNTRWARRSLQWIDNGCSSTLGGLAGGGMVRIPHC